MTNNLYSEDGLVEAATQQVLLALGWEVVTAWHNENFATTDRTTGLLGRFNESEVILENYLLQALEKFNPNLPAAVYQQAIQSITSKIADKSIGAINKEKYDDFKQGVEVTYRDEKGQAITKRLQIFDFTNPENNHFLAVRQFVIKGNLYTRRPDIIGFINGIPLVFFELKAHYKDLRFAFNDNLTDYKDTIPELFYYNAFVILSNGIEAKVGTITSPYNFFLDWKRITEEDEGVVDLDTLLRGICDKTNLMDLFENFLLFDGQGDTVTKIMAKNHQFLGVNKVVEKAKNLKDLQHKLGVFWHTQGSGKSYSIVFLCQKIMRKFGGSFTFLIVVDRSELENQIYDTFTGTGIVKESQKVKATSREHLKELLQLNHRYVFTLIHKFSFDNKKEQNYPTLTTRENIIVISDEAHRTQNGIFAQNMRFQALPNASFLGFTGTPLIDDEIEITKNIFGDYVSVYDFKQAIADGATLPLKYLNRGEKLSIENPVIDEAMAKAIKEANLTDDQHEKVAKLFKTKYPILTSEKRLRAIAKDVVWHFNERGYQGKAMFVALDKPTAVKMFNHVSEYWQDYLAELQTEIDNVQDEQEQLLLKKKYQRVKATEICVVVSSEQNEIQKFQKLELDIAIHREKMVKRDLEKEFKDESNPFRLVIVCSMWITGFDAPCVSTVYLDKPIQGHTLMQTIARANRVYNDEKENGLIVDYGNVYEQLKKAYLVYGDGTGNKQVNLESSNEKEELKLTYLAVELNEILSNFESFLTELGFQLSELVDAKTPLERLQKINQITNIVCVNQETIAKFEALATQVFKKYQALYPEKEAQPFSDKIHAIRAIYKRINPDKPIADILEITKQLQTIVDDSVTVLEKEQKEIEIDISHLNFEKLQSKFSKSDCKNKILFDLQKVVSTKLKKMIEQNPTRLDFYKEYEKIIEKYNDGKDANAVEQAFNGLGDLVNNMNVEESRAVREGLTEETLAIFDLLKKPTLTADEIAEVKKVAVKTFDELKEKVLKYERWRQNVSLTSGARIIIKNDLQHLPITAYPDEELLLKEGIIYQHIYGVYGGESNFYH
jgi:type I restriction enzyme R subunit